MMMKLIAFAAVIATSILVHSAIAQTVHVVGDTLGWCEPPQDDVDAYSTWASNKTFNLGDILVFNFTTNSHDVQRVEKDSYDACNSANSLGEIITTGPANVTLSSVGLHYYICTIANHCLSGQKLSITVLEASGAGGDTPPVPVTGPSSSTTRPGSPPPLESSSIASFASFILILLSIAVGLFF